MLRLQEELEDYKRQTSDLKSQIREAQIKFSNLEGKLKDEQLMGRIKEAENTQIIAELKHKISSLEVKNQEMETLRDLRGLDDNEDVNGDTNADFPEHVVDFLSADVIPRPQAFK